MSLPSALPVLEDPEGAPAPTGEKKATQKDESTNDDWAFFNAQQ